MNPYAALSPGRARHLPPAALRSPELCFDELIASAAYRLMLAAERWIKRLRDA